MRKKLLDDEVNEESKNDDDSKEKSSDINEIKKMKIYGESELYVKKIAII